MAWRARAAPALVAVLAFVGTVEGLRPHVPLPDDDGVRIRFAHLARVDVRYDVVVIGASTVMRGFDPDAFDATLAELGAPLRSFNLGVPGAFQFEVDHLIDLVLERSANPPRFLLVELPTRRLGQILASTNRFGDRAVYWHTPGRTLDYLRSIAHESPPEPELAPRLDALRHAAWRWASVGQADRVLGRVLDVSAAARAEAAGEVADTRGFRPFPIGPEAPQSDMRDELLASPRWFEGVIARVDAINQAPPKRRVLDPAWVSAQIARAEARGATVVYVTTPTILQTAELHALHRAGVIPHLLAFDSPERHPELYLIQNRFDAVHLNELGARGFSRALARDFAAWRESAGI